VRTDKPVTATANPADWGRTPISGTTAQAAAPPVATFYLLKEDGDALLKEDGDNILKEDAL
jgi:hypothetical protein